MINGAHVILYSPDAEGLRRWIRETLGFASVDAGDGWPIFRLPPAELAVHPADGVGAPAVRHQLYLMCGDIHATLDQLAARGAEPAGPVTDLRWGLLTGVKLPGGGELGLYQPKHASPHPPSRRDPT
jgi:hypothetical protein